MAAVNEAWRVLGDPERRAAYDATLEADRSLPRNAHEPARTDAAFVRTVDEPDESPTRNSKTKTGASTCRSPTAAPSRPFGILLAVTGAPARLAAVIALFTYAILWAGLTLVGWAGRRGTGGPLSPGGSRRAPPTGRASRTPS